MPAETHTHAEAVDARTVLDFLAVLVGVDPDSADTVTLAEIDLDDDLAALHLWAAVVEEFGERSLGDFEPPEPLPATLSQLAGTFHEALSP